MSPHCHTMVVGHQKDAEFNKTSIGGENWLDIQDPGVDIVDVKAVSFF